jgi:hypothetical protein
MNVVGAADCWGLLHHQRGVAMQVTLHPYHCQRVAALNSHPWECLKSYSDNVSGCVHAQASHYTPTIYAYTHHKFIKSISRYYTSNFEILIHSNYDGLWII